MTIIASQNIGTESWHGTLGGTAQHHCKCLACRSKWNEYYRQLHKARSENLDPHDPRHGTLPFYRNYGCRCIPCKAANTAACRASRERKRQEAAA